MNILNNFRSSRRMHTKRKGGAGDNECDICFESKTQFDKLNCKKCSDKGSKICKDCAGIIKIQKKNCPMCRGEIQHSFTSLRDKIVARKKVEKMENPAASSSPRRAAPARSPPRRAAPASRSSPNTERTLRTRQSRASNQVDASRKAASAASRSGARSRR
jgi:hypothetical protein